MVLTIVWKISENFLKLSFKLDTLVHVFDRTHRYYITVKIPGTSANLVKEIIENNCIS